MYEYIRQQQMIFFLLTGAKKKISTGPCKIIYSYLLLKEFISIDFFIAPVIKKRIIYGHQSKKIESINFVNKLFNFKKVNYCQYRGTYLVYNPFLYRFETYTNFSVSNKLNIMVYEFIRICNSRFIEKYSPGSMVPNFTLNLQDYIVKNWY